MNHYLKDRNIRRKRRSLRVRKHVRGTAQKPRLSVFRSNQHLSAQVIDDEQRVTLFGIGTLSKGLKGTAYGKKSKDAARQIGKMIAEEAKKRRIESVVFDRGHYKYHGLVAEIAEGAREAGLTF